MVEADPVSPYLLSFGIVVGGVSPSSLAVDEALSSVARNVAALRTRFPNEGLKINIVFHVPGPLSQPDYSGVHVRRVNAKTQHMLVHAAVPDSLSSDDITQYVTRVLLETKNQARAYLQKRRPKISMNQVDSLINVLLRQLHAPDLGHAN